ncbi:MAG: 30S ribosomal protein S4 [Clostridia bacterium]|jgi:small subunit ribosomal protein S4|nr:30S ribosomal protein S4 [Clostridia bacterium]
MARYTGSVCRLCRREGCKLFLKGDRCYGPNCAFTKRQTPPGEHGQARQRKMSEYGLQLREKQKAKRAYGVLENQFHSYFETAANQKGITGENLLVMLERRLDNVVYRCGFGASRAMARQLVRHGHVYVNGKKVNIPSALVDVNDEITIRAKSAESDYFKAMREGTGKVIPKWITLDSANLKATVTATPARDDIDLTIQENLIVELYSR